MCASRFMHLRASGMHIHRLKIRNLISWDTVEKIHQHFPAKWMPACAFLCPCPHNINMHALFDQTAAVLRVQFVVGTRQHDAGPSSYLVDCHAVHAASLLCHLSSRIFFFLIFVSSVYPIHVVACQLTVDFTRDGFSFRRYFRTNH